MTNEELIAALEAADGPSRELERDIALLRGLYPHTVDLGCYHDPAMVGEGGVTWSPPPYTSSIDAALMLVPAQISGRNVFPQISKVTADRWDCHLGAPGPKAQGVLGSAPTPALAICIAAIKAGGEG